MKWLLKLLLLPFTILYWSVTMLRNLLFDLRILRHTSFDIPVISVGNITVGGTGKTPHIEYLVRIAQRAGAEVACLSRGYKRSTSGFVLHKPGMDVSELGDEPTQIAEKFSTLHVAVCEDRVTGIRRLIDDFPSLSCILLDDAFQHRHVLPSLSILLTDFNRPIWDDWVFPGGMMREGFYARFRAHIVIVSKCPDDMTVKRADYCRQMLSLKAWQYLFFSKVAYGDAVDIRTGECTAMTARSSVLTGIAQHEAFVEYVRSKTKLMSESHFADHHHFSNKELRRILKKADKHGYAVVTTEKDASRMRGNTVLDEFPQVEILYVPIVSEILFGQASLFDEIVYKHITEFGR